MKRLTGVVLVVAVVVLAMAFAAANAGNRATLDLGLFAFYQIPVTLVAFSGLLVGMLVMFAVGIQTDLKIREILRDRLAEETREEQVWIDRNQQDLFAPDGLEGGEPHPEPSVPSAMAAPAPGPSLSSVDSQQDEEAEAEATGNPGPPRRAEEAVRAKPVPSAENPETEEGEPELQ